MKTRRYPQINKLKMRSSIIETSVPDKFPYSFSAQKNMLDLKYQPIIVRQINQLGCQVRN